MSPCGSVLIRGAQELEQRRGTRKADLDACRRTFKSNTASCSSKKKELARLAVDEKALQADFAKLMAEAGSHTKFLTKMFKRKVKRRGSDYDSDAESEEDEEDYESSEDEGSDMDDFDDTVCPAGCSPQLYRQVFDLRERRLDLEDALGQERKAMELLQKEADSAERKEGQLKAAVAAADKEIAEFQTEKQAQLNELQVSVPLALSQVYHVG